MYSIFHIEGGIGKNILATAVIDSLKKTDPKRNIIVVSAWPQVWFNNPNVYQIFPMGQVANFYKNFIKDQDVKIFRVDPYHSEDYILNKKHLIQVWCDLVGAKYNGETPKLYFSPLELEGVKNRIRGYYIAVITFYVLFICLICGFYWKDIGLYIWDLLVGYKLNNWRAALIITIVFIILLVYGILFATKNKI